MWAEVQSLDLHKEGKHIALIDEGGNLRVSDVDSDTSSSEIRLNFTQSNFWWLLYMPHDKIKPN